MKSFLQPGVVTFADELDMQPSASIIFEGLSLRTAQEALAARAKNPTNWLDAFGKAHPNVMKDGGIDSDKIDENGNPVIKAHITLTTANTTLSGSDRRAQTLVHTVSSTQHARYELEGNYTLEFDPPYFKHTLALDLRGYADSVKIKPENMQAVFIDPGTLNTWKNRVGKRLAAQYNSIIHAGGADPRYSKVLGTASIGRLTRAAKAKEREVRELSNQCKSPSASSNASGS